MSLNWDLTKCVDLDKHYPPQVVKKDDPGRGVKKGDELQNPITNAIIWGCMGIGIGEITEASYEEWYGRFELMERVYGRSLFRTTRGGKARPVAIMLADVRRHIGLRTNVSPKRPDGQFLKQVCAYAVEQAKRAEEATVTR